MYDLMIIGGGPAGMTAAVYAARKKLSTLLISQDLGGQPNVTAGIENYMGYQFIEGPELMEKFEKQVKQFPVDMKIGQGVSNLSQISQGFEVRIGGDETYEAKTAIVATGKRSRLLNVPGEEKLRGKGITYCAVCDGPLFGGMKVAVIGGGNSALEAAIDMVRIADHTYLISLTPLTGDLILIDKLEKANNLMKFLEHEVLEIEGENFVEGIRIRDLKTRQERELDVGGVFVEIGLIPNSEFVKGVVTLNHLGEIEVNCANETSVPGLFAAGDVTSVPEKQIVIAAGEGAKATLQAYSYLQRLSE
jgi:alkyl hydroperoxide reductase subunit F